jgi:hypothetical protein
MKGGNYGYKVDLSLKRVRKPLIQHVIIVSQRVEEDHQS